MSKQFMVTFRKKSCFKLVFFINPQLLLPKGKGKERDPNLQKLVTGHLEKQRNLYYKVTPHFWKITLRMDGLRATIFSSWIVRLTRTKKKRKNQRTTWHWCRPMINRSTNRKHLDTKPHISICGNLAQGKGNISNQ